MIRIPEYLERRRATGLAESGRRRRPTRELGGRPRTPGAVAAPLTVLFAPDSFKGSLTSVEVAGRWPPAGLGPGPTTSSCSSPLADGGEGTLEAIAAAGGWTWRNRARPRPARAGRITRAGCRSDGRPDGRRRDGRGVGPVARAARTSATRSRATTVGTGELIRAAVDAGRQRISLGIGGSATTDGGRGLLAAWAVDVDAADAGCRVDSTQARSTSSSPATSRTRCWARPARRRPTARRRARRRDAGRRARRAAGGVGRRARGARPGGTSARRRARARPAASASRCSADPDRFRVVRAAARRRARRWRRPSSTASSPGRTSCITGEGRIDEQTAFGKTALGVARRAAAAGVRASPSAAA